MENLITTNLNIAALVLAGFDALPITIGIGNSSIGVVLNNIPEDQTDEINHLSVALSESRQYEARLLETNADQAATIQEQDNQLQMALAMAEAIRAEIEQMDLENQMIDGANKAVLSGAAMFVRSLISYEEQIDLANALRAIDPNQFDGAAQFAQETVNVAGTWLVKKFNLTDVNVGRALGALLIGQFKSEIWAENPLQMFLSK